MSAKPKADADKRRNEQFWQLFLVAFQRLIDRHLAIPPHLYAEAGDREFEDARDIAHHALTLAIAAAHEFDNHKKRVAEFKMEIE